MVSSTPLILWFEQTSTHVKTSLFSGISRQPTQICFLKNWVMAKYPWVMGKFPWVMEKILGFLENVLYKRDLSFFENTEKKPGIDPVSEWCHKNNLIVKVCILAERIIFFGRHVHPNREQGLYFNAFVRLSYRISRMTDRWNSFPIGPIICKCDATEYPLWLIFASMNWTFH